MGAIATFNFTAFVAAYPEFAAISSAQGQAFWDLGTLYWPNDGTGPVCDQTTQTNLLNMMTAHIAWLKAPRDAAGNPAESGQPASAIVGRITSANQGSVSVSAENQYSPGTEQWYQQTRYGSAFFAATAAFRTARYLGSGRRRNFQPWRWPQRF
jgi:hypothetical protein